ncbi:hypothetical protein HZ326_2272 [Fusarium oxysporum f. sp. albedinis]|nr:hypothetical protein HZ326_2272 [Fusarium oxysporum f. sp. albedinis]
MTSAYTIATLDCVYNLWGRTQNRSRISVAYNIYKINSSPDKQRSEDSMQICWLQVQKECHYAQHLGDPYLLSSLTREYPQRPFRSRWVTSLILRHVDYLLLFTRCSLKI